MIQPSNNNQLFVGVMSGTSLDGIDTVLTRFDSSSDKPHLIAAHNATLPVNIRERILALCRAGTNEICKMAELDVELGELFAEAIIVLLQKSSINPRDITAIGCHGQTIRHHTADSHRQFSLQIGDPNTIALQTGITTVADFRRMDIAAGGQGAPLVPAFHDALLRHSEETRIVVNIGGMANITLLADGQPAIGFDTGPGNVLMDAWIQKHLDQPWDQNGDWALQGEVEHTLLAKWLQHPFFQQKPPKSTGRETFNLDWAMSYLDSDSLVAPTTIQRTLLELTAQTITGSVKKLPTKISRVLLCGGGSHNLLLRQRIAELLPESITEDTGAHGIDPDWMEAIAFAWLAKQRLGKKPGNLPTVTGAETCCILGGVYEPPNSIVTEP